MDLPILKVTSAPTVETLVRYYHQTQSNWTAHVAESEVLDFGTAWCNPELSRVHDANRILDVALPEGMTAERALEEAETYFASRGTACWQWVMNPSAPAAQRTPMVELLTSRGYSARAGEILYLQHFPGATPARADESLKIIPARASFRHARALHEESAAEWNEPQLVEAAMLHLDDPHYDALLALKDGTAVATVGVLAVGEIGLIEPLFVTASMRRQGLGALMMSRAMEICARSLFKHVFIGVLPDNAPAIGLYGKFGFKKIGECVEYKRPAQP